MSDTTPDLGRDAPENFVPLSVACYLLAGGAKGALAAAREYLLIAVGSQGTLGNGKRIDIKLRWSQPEVGGELYVHAPDAEALRELFGNWIGKNIPAAQLVPEIDVAIRVKAQSTQKPFSDLNVRLCKRRLTEMMGAGDPIKGQSKPELKKRFTNEFNIPGRQFDKAWDDAVAKSGNGAWSKPGRRSKKKS